MITVLNDVPAETSGSKKCNGKCDGGCRGKSKPEKNGCCDGTTVTHELGSSIAESPRNSRNESTLTPSQQTVSILEEIQHHQNAPHPADEHDAQRKSKSSRTLLNFWLDAFLMINFAVLSAVGMILQFVFPPGMAARGWTLWGMNHTQWSGFQFGLLAILALGILVHVMLHWTWICGVVTRRLLNRSQLPDDGIRTLYGVGLLIGLLISGATLVGLAKIMIHTPPSIPGP